MFIIVKRILIPQPLFVLFKNPEIIIVIVTQSIILEPEKHLAYSLIEPK